jgi:hypothetical protein
LNKLFHKGTRSEWNWFAESVPWERTETSNIVCQNRRSCKCCEVTGRWRSTGIQLLSKWRSEDVSSGRLFRR